ncbi:hypothetical protein [Streptomyces sp. MZ04]|uniref:hypothetical protein n=1 Tax=Streptomyces sp. MZ04 TaxID=2559236 RepID=UPI001432DE4A|nr:hypothetical protein [Streptomyces sp. MZ04]
MHATAVTASAWPVRVSRRAGVKPLPVAQTGVQSPSGMRQVNSSRKAEASARAASSASTWRRTAGAVGAWMPSDVR